MNRLLSGLGIMLMAGALALPAGHARADEKFVPQGFSYRPGDTRLPPINSQRYRIISRADLLESEIYVSKKQRSDFEDYIYRNQQRDMAPPRPGWRFY
jgi:hypothetical protein